MSQSRRLRQAMRGGNMNTNGAVLLQRHSTDANQVAQQFILSHFEAILVSCFNLGSAATGVPIPMPQALNAVSQGLRVWSDMLQAHCLPPSMQAFLPALTLRHAQATEEHRKALEASEAPGDT